MNVMKRSLKSVVLAFIGIMTISTAPAQNETVEPVLYGNMDKWIVRSIEESSIIGGETKYVYEIGAGDTLRNNVPYRNYSSPWAVSSVLATVKGVTKASVTVFPERRGRGYCARMETRIETVTVLGLIDINVLAGGTMFLGEMIEPITDTKDPMSKFSAGIPFKKRPDYLQFDYRVRTGGKSIKSTGFSRRQELGILDYASTTVILQKRWEDENGNIYAKRVGTAMHYFTETQNIWQNNFRVEISYGDISTKPFYRQEMALKTGDDTIYARNSKGQIVKINEIGWADENETPTHLYLQFSSSNGGAYIGSIDNRLWVDNVAFVYKK